MVSLLSGLGLLVGAVALLYPFIPAKGTTPNRGDGVDVVVAMTVTGMLALGLAFLFLGAATLFG